MTVHINELEITVAYGGGGTGLISLDVYKSGAGKRDDRWLVAVLLDDFDFSAYRQMVFGLAGNGQKPGFYEYRGVVGAGHVQAIYKFALFLFGRFAQTERANGGFCSLSCASLSAGCIK